MILTKDVFCCKFLFWKRKAKKDNAENKGIYHMQ